MSVNFSGVPAMIRWPKIQHYSHMIAYIRKYRPDLSGGKWLSGTWVPTVKLHGTNAGIRLLELCDDLGHLQEWMIPQSRNRYLTPASDNMEFAAHVQANKDSYLVKMRTLADELRRTDITVFGEWIGKGIGNAAVSQLQRKFVAFGIYNGENFLAARNALRGAGFDSVWDARDIGELNAIAIYNGDYEAAVETIRNLTLRVEAECPYAAEFGVSGVGEGLVWRNAENPYDTSLWFKSKGDEHKNAKKRVDPASPDIVAKVDSFLENEVSEERLQQGLDWLREMGLPTTVQSTGKFLGYVLTDLQKETMLDLEQAGLTWANVKKDAGRKVVAWYSSKCEGSNVEHPAQQGA